MPPCHPGGSLIDAAVVVAAAAAAVGEVWQRLSPMEAMRLQPGDIIILIKSCIEINLYHFDAIWVHLLFIRNLTFSTNQGKI